MEKTKGQTVEILLIYIDIDCKQKPIQILSDLVLS